MPAPESIRRAYDLIQPIAQSVELYVRETLLPFCGDNNYLFYGRVKDLDSVSEKIEGGMYPAWSDLDDLYACTVVIPTASHEEKVLEELNRVFIQKAIRSRGTAKKAPDVFRFDTTRYYGTLTKDAAALRLPGIQNFIFEVQIPTVFEFAWATVTHDLVYKGDSISWTKLRLAAHLKATVEQADLTVAAFDQVAEAVPESSWPDVEAKAAVVRGFRDLIDSGFIRSELAPRSWRRFAENVYGLVASYTPRGRDRPDATARLLTDIAAYLKSDEAPPPPTSGSLFQLVVGYVSQAGANASIQNYRIANSNELVSLYGVSEIPRRFTFDLPGDLASEVV